MYCSIWPKILNGFPYWKGLLPFDFVCGKIALFHLAENSHRFFRPKWKAFLVLSFVAYLVDLSANFNIKPRTHSDKEVKKL